MTAGGVSRNVIHRKYVLLCHGLTIPMAVEVEKANHHGWMGERTIQSTDKKLRMMTLTPDEADERGAWWKIFMGEPGRKGNERVLLCRQRQGRRSRRRPATATEMAMRVMVMVTASVSESMSASASVTVDHGRHHQAAGCGRNSGE